MGDLKFPDWVATTLNRSDQDRQDALNELWQRFDNAHLVPRVVVHRVLCKRCGPIVTVISVQGRFLAHHRDVKLGKGMNASSTHEVARRESTIDGERWWPSYVEDLSQAENWGADRVVSVQCRHLNTTLVTKDLLDKCRAAAPGKPGKPTIL